MEWRVSNRSVKSGQTLPQCPRCQTEVSASNRFCPNCGAQLFAPPALGYPAPSASGPTVPEERHKQSKTWIAVAALIIVALLVTVSLLAFIPTAGHVSSGIPANGCPTGSGASNTASAPVPGYDVQELMAFTQSYSQLEFNVTAIAQCDANGYGPAYLINGLSNTGYWYQVGINWNWPLQSGGYVQGFGFVSEDWAPGGLSRSPSSSPFSGTVNQNDTIQLSLYFSGGRVVASARDLNTSASASTTYPANGATTFVGLQAQQSRFRFSFATRGYFTGLMTEWYHVSPNATGPGEGVVYSETSTPIASATVGVGEWNFTTSAPVSVFSSAANNGNPIDLSAQSNQLQQFDLNGFALSVDAYEFVTGP